MNSLTSFEVNTSTKALILSVSLYSGIVAKTLAYGLFDASSNTIESLPGFNLASKIKF